MHSILKFWRSGCVDRVTYQRLDEAVRIELELPYRLLLIRRALHNLACVVRTQVRQDCLHLVAGGRLLLHLEIELLLLGLRLVRARGLVYGGGGRGVGLRLLEQVDDADGRRGCGLVEDGYDVLDAGLRGKLRVSLRHVEGVIARGPMAELTSPKSLENMDILLSVGNILDCVCRG